jgi:hypothetical protein
MDGLIQLMIADLAGERSPADMPEFRQRLEAVPKQRQALCRHVDATAGAAFRQQPERAGAADLLAQGSSASPGFMMDAAVRTWRAYREPDQIGRASIIAGIEAPRWLSYADVPAA